MEEGDEDFSRAPHVYIRLDFSGPNVLANGIPPNGLANGIPPNVLANGIPPNVLANGIQPNVVSVIDTVTV